MLFRSAAQNCQFGSFGMELDRYVEQTGWVPKVIKLDAEGAELAILRGARKTIERHRPAFTMEFNPESMAAAKSTVAEIHAWFKSLGYRVLVLRANELRGYTLADSEPFDEAKHCAKSFCNVVCVPSE